MDEESQPSLVSIQRWRVLQEASSSQVLTEDGSVSVRAVKDTSHRSEASTDGQRDKSNRLATAKNLLTYSSACTCTSSGCIYALNAKNSGVKVAVIVSPVGSTHHKCYKCTCYSLLRVRVC